MSDDTMTTFEEPHHHEHHHAPPVPVDPKHLPTVNVGGRNLAVYDLGEDEGAGLENTGIREQLIPFITILQGLSPQVNPEKPEHIEGATMGMLFNTATQELYDVRKRGELPFIPCFREHQYTEWLPRDSGGGGGGFRGIHSPDDAHVKRAIAEARAKYGRTAEFRPIPFKNLDDGKDTVLVEQYNLGILFGWPEMHEAMLSRALVAFTSTKIPVYLKFREKLNELKYAKSNGSIGIAGIFMHKWRLGVVGQNNAKGDFYNFKLNLDTPAVYQDSLVPTSTPIGMAAKQFYEQHRDGETKGDYEAAAATASNTAGAGGGGGRVDPDDDQIPF